MRGFLYLLAFFCFALYDATPAKIPTINNGMATIVGISGTDGVVTGESVAEAETAQTFE